MTTCGRQDPHLMNVESFDWVFDERRGSSLEFGIQVPTWRLARLGEPHVMTRTGEQVADERCRKRIARIRLEDAGKRGGVEHLHAGRDLRDPVGIRGRSSADENRHGQY